MEILSRLARRPCRRPAPVRSRHRAPLAALLALTVAAVSLLLSGPALAGTQPVVTGLSVHRDGYWGGLTITVYGRNFAGSRSVTFGARTGWGLRMLSSTALTVRDPEHSVDDVYVRVTTGQGTSERTAAAAFHYVTPTMNTPIQGGLTGRQEQHAARQVVAQHHAAYVSPRSRQWTAAMGATAVRRARSWLGMPYSWAGGTYTGPTRGVCAHNGGDLDCHIVGFDCSGLALYSWGPYLKLPHYAASQYRIAGRVHPGIGELVPGDLVFFSGYIPNGIGHVAVYAGHGNVVQAEQSGTQVMMSPLVDVIAGSGAYRGATRPLALASQAAAAPVVTGLTTSLPTRGGSLAISGRGLGSVTSVGIAGTLYYSFTRTSDGRIVLPVPAHRAGAVTVTVSNAWHTVRRTVRYVPPPAIATLTPATGTTDGGTAVQISGSNLAAATSVTVDGMPVPFDVLPSGRLSIVTPAHAAGAVPVQVVAPTGTSAAKTYTYLGSSSTPTPPSSTVPPSSTTPTPSPTPSSSTTPSSTTPPNPTTSSIAPTPSTTSAGSTRAKTGAGSSSPTNPPPTTATTSLSAPTPSGATG